MLLGCIATANAQTKYKAYCNIIGHTILGGECQGHVSYITIDYGQSKLKKNYLVDNEGKALKFGTMISAINYMSKFGWNLEDTYHTTEKTFGNLIIVYILSKEVTDDSEITQGFQTRYMYEQQKGK